MNLMKKYLGFILGLLSLVSFQVLSRAPWFVEHLYTNLLYKAIRAIYAKTFFYIPFPLIYAFLLSVSIVIGVHFYRRIKKKNKIKTFNFILNFSGWLIFLFYFLWGFNYARTDFNDRINLNIVKPDSTFLLEELIRTDSICLAIRKQLSEVDTVALSETMLPLNYQDIIRVSQKKIIKFLGEPDFAQVKIRELRPSGSLLRIKTAGVYFPFVFEGQIDNGLHAIEKPYVLAHEMAHANAITDEGVANFIGFLTCINSGNPFVEYSAWLEYEGHLFSNLRRNNKTLLIDSCYSRPDFVIADLKAIIERLNQYPDIAPKIRDLFYNNYLKVQGVHAGMESYSQIVQLAYSYKLKNKNFEINL